MASKDSAATKLVNEAQTLAGDEQAAGGGDGSGNEAYILASKIGWRIRFDSYKKFKAFLDRTPAIRTRSPSRQRLQVHAADWATYWADQEARQFESLDVDPEALGKGVALAQQRKQQLPRHAGRK